MGLWASTDRGIFCLGISDGTDFLVGQRTWSECRYSLPMAVQKPKSWTRSPPVVIALCWSKNISDIYVFENRENISISIIYSVLCIYMRIHIYIYIHTHIYIYISLCGDVSKPCTPFVHIKIAGIYGCSSPSKNAIGILIHPHIKTLFPYHKIFHLSKQQIFSIAIFEVESHTSIHQPQWQCWRSLVT